MSFHNTHIDAETMRFEMSSSDIIKSLKYNVFIFQALLCNICGDVESRNNYSFQYKQNESKCCCDSSFEPDTVML